MKSLERLFNRSVLIIFLKRASNFTSHNSLCQKNSFYFIHSFSDNVYFPLQLSIVIEVTQRHKFQGSLEYISPGILRDFSTVSNAVIYHIILIPKLSMFFHTSLKSFVLSLAFPIEDKPWEYERLWYLQHLTISSWEKLYLYKCQRRCSKDAVWTQVASNSRLI